MGNNRAFEAYSIGYDPDAVEHDLQIISQLTRGMTGSKKKLTMQQAQAIYYRIKEEDIQFRSNMGEEFLLNLYENMTDAQIQQINSEIRRKRQRKQSRRQLVRINRKIAAAVSAVVLVSSILCINWSLLMDLRTNYQTKKLQEKVIVQADSLSADGLDTLPSSDENEGAAPPSDGNGAGIEENSASSSEILLKFTQLYSENQDFAGWLRIPGTKIDYPVMSREGDNNYYLDKNFEQQHDKNGLLILDYRSSIQGGTVLGGQNLIIYGHNMKDGSMFGNLDQYQEQTFYQEHPFIQFHTLYEERTYQVLAVFYSQVYQKDENVFKYYQFYQANTEAEFWDFYENIMTSSLITSDVTATFGDTFLTLSTCAYHVEDGRFVVVAKRIN